MGEEEFIKYSLYDLKRAVFFAVMRRRNKLLTAP